MVSTGEYHYMQLSQRALENVMLQRTKTVHTKIEVLDRRDMVVGEITGLCTEGSVSINSDTMVRRTLNMTFVASRKIEIQEQSLLWINKRLRVFVGVERFNADIIWFNMGVYIISNPQTSFSKSGRTISITGNDKMVLFEQPFMNECIISAGTPIHTAIRQLAALVGESKTMVEDTDKNIPYEFQPSPTDTVDKYLKDFTNLYMNYQIYYNTDGYLVFEKTKNKLNDPIVWEFKGKKNFTISRSIVSDYDGIKNRVKVIGAYDSKTGRQPKYEITITGVDKMFSVDNIGERRACYTEDDYTTEEQCRLKCEYEIEQVQNMEKVFTINTVPVFMLNDVNKLIRVVDNGTEYTCVVDKITIPLVADGNMNITCHQIFS